MYKRQVEKKEGKLKKHDDVVITDLPGIYSLSPYTLEEEMCIRDRCYYVIIIYAAVFHVKRGKCLEYRLYLCGFCAKMTVK